MHAQRAVTYDLVQLADTNLATIVALEGTAGNEAALVNREHFAPVFLVVAFFKTIERADFFLTGPVRLEVPKCPRNRSKTAGDSSAGDTGRLAALAVRAAFLAEPSETEPTRRRLYEDGIACWIWVVVPIRPN